MAIAVLTGDLVNSAELPAESWMKTLKGYLEQLGESPKDWEIYRGDEFQLRLPAEQALRVAFTLKAILKAHKPLDVRLAIGIGQESYQAPQVSQSNGTAYQRSGRTFEQLKAEKLSMQLHGGHPRLDRDFNLVLRLGMDFMDQWSSVSAEIMALVLQQPDLAQREIAAALNIKQSAVSQRLKRARKDLVFAILEQYSQILEAL